MSAIAVYLVAAVVAVPLFRRFGLGSILGYLVAGVIIGPLGLDLVHDVEGTMHFAEFGVVLLLFLIGLELEPARLWKMRGIVFGTGTLQVGLTALVLAGAARLFGVPWTAAAVAGLGLSMSSTAFALQALAERSELAQPYGRTAFGVLLFQDLAAIPALAVLPLLVARDAAGAEGSSSSMLGRLPVTALVLALLLLAGRFLIRPVFRFIAMAKSHELSIAWALLVVVGTAMIMQKAGLSMALGAFLAGVLLADSEYRHELEANIEPFKGLLLGLFFMAVGMSANLRILVARPGLVVGLVVGLVAVKGAVLALLGMRCRLVRDQSISLGIILSQGGEFAFVIFGEARGSGVMPSALAEVLVVVVTLSMVTTPFLLMARDPVVRRWLTPKDDRPFDTVDEDGSRVIIAGFGRFGQVVARLLRSKKIRFTALEASPTQVDFVRRFGNRIYYGDASRMDLLRAAKAHDAKVFVLAIDDPDASVRTAKAVMAHFPHLRIVARARNRAHAYALLELGIPTVVRETFHSALDAGREALEALGVGTEEAREAARRFGVYDENQVRTQFVNRGDERALIEGAKRAAEELERLFEDDTRQQT